MQAPDGYPGGEEVLPRSLYTTRREPRLATSVSSSGNTTHPILAHSERPVVEGTLSRLRGGQNVCRGSLCGVIPMGGCVSGKTRSPFLRLHLRASLAHHRSSVNEGGTHGSNWFHLSDIDLNCLPLLRSARVNSNKIFTSE